MDEYGGGRDYGARSGDERVTYASTFCTPGAFSKSAFSSSGGAAASCGMSMVDLSVPGFVAKSPTLIKAKIAVETAALGPTRPCHFKVHGKRQQFRPRDGSDGCGAAVTTTITSPRPSLRVLIRRKAGDVAGYSPRLRKMNEDVDTMTNNGGITHKTAPVAIEECVESTATPTMVVRAHNQTAMNKKHSLAAVSVNNDTGLRSSEPRRRRRHRPCTCLINVTCETCQLEYDASLMRTADPSTAPTLTAPTLGKANALTAATLRHRHPPPSSSSPQGLNSFPPPRCSLTWHSHHQPQERPVCGRLWTGTTASPRSGSRPERGTTPSRPRRTLFLVSGQGQQPKRQQQQQADIDVTNLNKHDHQRAYSRSSAERHRHGRGRGGTGIAGVASGASIRRRETRRPHSAAPTPPAMSRRAATAPLDKIESKTSRRRLPAWGWERRRQRASSSGSGPGGDRHGEEEDEAWLTVSSGPAEDEDDGGGDSGCGCDYEEDQEYDEGFFVESMAGEEEEGGGGGGGEGRGIIRRRGRKVLLRVRVPRAPPTSLLVLRSAPLSL